MLKLIFKTFMEILMDGLPSLNVREWHVVKHPRDTLIRSTKGFLSGVLGYIAIDFARSPYVMQSASCLISCSFPEATQISKNFIVLTTLAVASVQLARAAVARKASHPDAESILKRAPKKQETPTEEKSPETESLKKDSE